jgi:hypothetical protein
MSKYTRKITQTLADEDQGFTISVDVYDVLRAFNVTDPAIQHAVKKLLCTGIRGHKNSKQDLQEAIQSIERALDVIKTDEKLAEVMAESQSVTSDSPPQSPVCPFKVGDVIHHREDVHDRSDVKWRVTGETAKSLQVVSVDPYQTPSFIERQCWHRYAKVEQPAAEPTELPACPFKAGDIIRGIGEPNTSKWKVERVRSHSIDVTTYDVHKHRAYIDHGRWGNYIKVDPIDGTPVDAPPQQCPFVVGDVIRSIKFPQYIFHVTEINSDDIIAYNREACSNHVIPRAQWNGYEIKTLISIDKPNQTC